MENKQPNKNEIKEFQTKYVVSRIKNFVNNVNCNSSFLKKFFTNL